MIKVIDNVDAQQLSKNIDQYVKACYEGSLKHDKYVEERVNDIKLAVNLLTGTQDLSDHNNPLQIRNRQDSNYLYIIGISQGLLLSALYPTGKIYIADDIAEKYSTGGTLAQRDVEFAAFISNVDPDYDMGSILYDDVESCMYNGYCPPPMASDTYKRLYPSDLFVRRLHFVPDEDDEQFQADHSSQYIDCQCDCVFSAELFEDVLSKALGHDRVSVTTSNYLLEI